MAQAAGSLHHGRLVNPFFITVGANLVAGTAMVKRPKLPAVHSIRRRFEVGTKPPAGGPNPESPATACVVPAARFPLS